LEEADVEVLHIREIMCVDSVFPNNQAWTFSLRRVAALMPKDSLMSNKPSPMATGLSAAFAPQGNKITHSEEGKESVCILTLLLCLWRCFQVGDEYGGSLAAKPDPNALGSGAAV
jgi:hypothetical protein